MPSSSFGPSRPPRPSLTPLGESKDTLVVGAGPVGCVTALTQARAGRRVTLVDSRRGLPTRLAGEWLHPPAVTLLRELGVDLGSDEASYAGRGFVVFPDDGSAPILLDYPDARCGASLAHEHLVSRLRQAAEEHPLVELRLGCTVERSEHRGQVRVRDATGAPGRAEPKARSGRVPAKDRAAEQLGVGLLVAADGRASTLRRDLGLHRQPLPVSHTAGLLLRDVELPFEGYGHVFLGGAGPLLAYRIGDDVVRLCVDVPSTSIRCADKRALLWDGYAHRLPLPLREALRRALEAKDLAWAANHFAERRCFAGEGVALVGDAVGYYHPMTAAGMTLGFFDAMALAEEPSLEAYQERRRRECRVPQLLAQTLYRVFSEQDGAMHAMRQGVYELWRKDPAERSRTMALLAGYPQPLHGFAAPLAKVLGRATTLVSAPRGRDGAGQRALAQGLVGRASDTLALLRRVQGLLLEALPADGAPLWRRALETLAVPAGRAAPTLPVAAAADKREQEIVSDNAPNAVAALLSEQHADGRWEGEVRWSSMLTAQYVLAHALIGRPIAAERREAILRTFALSEEPTAHGAASGWGLHPRSGPTLFTTTLVYVACRLLGIPGDDSRLGGARAFIEREGGVLRIPSWGKIWLAMLSLYEWRGVNPLLPEAWALPRWLPVHPRFWYCHTRLIYAPLAFVYGEKHQLELTPVLRELRRELYPHERYEDIDFGKAAGALRAEEVVTPPSPWLKAAFFVARTYEAMHLPGLRRRLQGQLLEEIRFELETTGFNGISPVSGLLDAIALHLHDPQDPSLDRLLSGVERWSWNDASGYRIAGARSDVWDTSFALQALQSTDESARAHRGPIARGQRYLASQQCYGGHPAMEDHHRIDPRGGFGFTAAWQNWPVSDCTAEALLALLDGPSPLPRARAVDALRFIFRCQNHDGGFGSYEARKSRLSLEWLNPAEMFGDSMSEHSYVECTASCIEAMVAFGRRYPEVLEEERRSSMARALRWLRRAQRRDGSFHGVWGVQLIYGTYFGIRGLMAAGASRDDPAILAACRWLLARQRSDGGWGESHLGCPTRSYVPAGSSQPVQTAWALLGLLEAGSSAWPSLQAGAACLAALQRADGTYGDHEPAGIFFQTGLLDYERYKDIFPAWALERYAERSRERSAFATGDASRDTSQRRRAG